MMNQPPGKCFTTGWGVRGGPKTRKSALGSTTLGPRGPFVADLSLGHLRLRRRRWPATGCCQRQGCWLRRGCQPTAAWLLAHHTRFNEPSALGWQFLSHCTVNSKVSERNTFSLWTEESVAQASSSEVANQNLYLNRTNTQCTTISSNYQDKNR